jgi:hypothetical protein
MLRWMFRAVQRGEAPIKPYEKLRKYWVDTDSHIATTMYDESEIAVLEARYCVQLPGDFRDYLLNGCPQADGDWDNALTVWWGLPRIKNIPEEYQSWPAIKNPVVLANAARYLFFADYSIWCWAWAIDCGDDENRGRVAVIGTGNDRFVANSFGEFVDRLIVDYQDVW